MASVNKVIIVGNLGRDPDIRQLASGDSVASLAIATTASWKDKATGEKKEQTEWHRVTAFGKLADIMGQYLRKGSQVYIEGSLRTRKYQRDGVDHYATEIRADQLQMLGSRQGGDAEHQTTPPPRPAAKPTAPARPAPDFSDMDDDIPFLFNMNTICDTVGTSKQLQRARHGKGLSIMWANQGDF